MTLHQSRVWLEPKSNAVNDHACIAFCVSIRICGKRSMKIRWRACHTSILWSKMRFEPRGYGIIMHVYCTRPIFKHHATPNRMRVHRILWSHAATPASMWQGGKTTVLSWRPMWPPLMKTVVDTKQRRYCSPCSFLYELSNSDVVVGFTSLDFVHSYTSIQELLLFTI